MNASTYFNFDPDLDLINGKHTYCTSSPDSKDPSPLDIKYGIFVGNMYGDTEKEAVEFYRMVHRLFAPYSGIGEPDQHVLDYVNKVLNNEVPSYGRGGEQFDFTSYPDNTIIYDMTPSFSDIKAQPITITLPTSDFKRILEHIIASQDANDPS